MGNYQAHPEVVAYFAETLRSLNARLGALLRQVDGAEDTGFDLDAMGVAYLHDLEMLGWRRENLVEDEDAGGLPSEEDEE